MTLAVVAGVWVVIALVALLVARAFGNKRITLEGSALTLVRGSSSRVLDLSDVERLEERRVKVGRTLYTAYFAVLKDGKAAGLLTEGQYPQRAQLKDAISAAAGKPWVTA
ncbi:MAG: hypothetical protein QME82_08455 [Bacillota bacterium]|nr:hypothetical protein [Bacillota bacterium]